MSSSGHISKQHLQKVQKRRKKISEKRLISLKSTDKNERQKLKTKKKIEFFSGAPKRGMKVGGYESGETL